MLFKWARTPSVSAWMRIVMTLMFLGVGVEVVVLPWGDLALTLALPRWQWGTLTYLMPLFQQMVSVADALNIMENCICAVNDKVRCPVGAYVRLENPHVIWIQMKTQWICFWSTLPSPSYTFLPTRPSNIEMDMGKYRWDLCEMPSGVLWERPFSPSILIRTSFSPDGNSILNYKLMVHSVIGNTLKTMNVCLTSPGWCSVSWKNPLMKTWKNFCGDYTNIPWQGKIISETNVPMPNNVSLDTYRWFL